jgi:hypothetical protein
MRAASLAEKLKILGLPVVSIREPSKNSDGSVQINEYISLSVPEHDSRVTIRRMDLDGKSIVCYPAQTEFRGITITIAHAMNDLGDEVGNLAKSLEIFAKSTGNYITNDEDLVKQLKSLYGFGDSAIERMLKVIRDNR